MALKSTVYKAMLQVADMDRSHYRDHALTLAQHPSETEERLMMRLLAHALQAPDDEHATPLLQARGLSDSDEPTRSARVSKRNSGPSRSSAAAVVNSLWLLAGFSGASPW